MVAVVSREVTAVDSVWLVASVQPRNTNQLVSFLSEVPAFHRHRLEVCATLARSMDGCEFRDPALNDNRFITNASPMMK